MKYVVCVPDGCADEPVDELGGRTPLEAASMPTLTGLARRGTVGRAAVIPNGMPPGSDIGNMAILGYDPARYSSGRAGVEAAALGLQVGPDQVVYRCNLVTLSDDGVMADFAGGHPPTEVAVDVIRALDEELGAGAADGLSFHPGVQYRHLMGAPAAWGEAECTPPHDLSDKPAVAPQGPAAGRLIDLMEASRPIVSRFGLAANQIWLWGQGVSPMFPAFRDLHGVDGGMCTAVDVVRGLGRLAGLEVVEVEGATGWYDTNYEGKRDTALRALADDVDFFLIHVESTDEAGHAGDLSAKVEALEHWDRRILGPLIEGLDGLGPWRLLLLPDHPTPVRLKTHTTDPVPYLLVDSTETETGTGTGGIYSEPATAACVPVPGHQLMSHLIRR